MGVGLTSGDLITAQLRFYVNAGSSLVAQDADLRERALYFLQEESDNAWTRYLWPFRIGSSSITLTSGVGSVPSDFGNMGTQGNLYLSTSPPNTPPLIYEPPAVLRARLQQDPTAYSQTPGYYTFDGVDPTTGLVQVLCWPVNTTPITLLFKDYWKCAPRMVDFPAAPVVADSGNAGNPDGTYRWGLSFVTASGSTEMGLLSDSLTVVTNQVSLSEIPVSPCPLVLYRDVYRNVASGVQWLKVGRISDNYTTTYTDNVADGSLTTAAPTVLTAVTGMEQWPADFQRTVLGGALRNRLMGSQGDLREAAGGAAWEARLLRMWADQNPGQNKATVLPAFGRAQGLTGRTARQRMPH